MKDATVRARIQLDTKTEAEEIIKRLGLNATQVINALYSQIILRKGLPFELKIPNKKTLDAMQELEDGRGHRYASMDELWNDIEG